jgi:hypothetical protein
LQIAAEQVVPRNTNLYTGTLILESVGLSPLMLAATCFMGLVYAHVDFDDYFLSTLACAVIL